MRLKNDKVIEVFSTNPNYMDRNLIEIGDERSDVHYYLGRLRGLPLRADSYGTIYVDSPELRNCHSNYYMHNDEVVAFHHISYKLLHGDPVPEAYKVSRLNEKVAENLLIDLISNVRKRVGVPQLQTTALHNKYAKEHSVDMCEKSYLRHSDRKGNQPLDYQKNGGVQYTMGSQSIGGNLTHPVTAFYSLLVRNAYEYSDIVNPSFKKLGVGAAYRNFYNKKAKLRSYYTILWTD